MYIKYIYYTIHLNHKTYSLHNKSETQTNLIKLIQFCGSLIYFDLVFKLL